MMMMSYFRPKKRNMAILCLHTEKYAI